MSEPVKFKRTAAAAQRDKQSKWDVIQSIAEDASEAGLPIVGIESRTEARKALKAAGHEHEDNTVRDLCLVAKFDHESTPAQRKTWRRYGWTIPHQFAKRGWSQEAAEKHLVGPGLLSKSEAVAIASGKNADDDTPEVEKPLDERWTSWVQRLSTLMTEGAKLAAETDDTGLVLGGYAALARELYDRLAERQIDAEYRQLLEAEK